MINNDFSNRVIKSYEFRECIGAGGFGAVYRAFQPSVSREVAIKVILPQYASQPDFIRRFEVEAQLIARLEHPHIVPLYDYWRDPDGAFLVMRWLSGSLRGALKKGAWAPEASARLLDQMASALAIAHREGVVHRDIKPDNILLDEDDNAYLADFGIAKDTNVGSTTEEGAVIGSPAYITPEQIKGEPITPRADIYTLGLVIYETLVGERPYADATTPLELISRHLNTPIPALNTHRANLPAALNEVLQTATAKDPNHRYTNMQRFAMAFRAALPNIQRTPNQPLSEPLTDRELEILRLIVDGLSNADIVARLVLTEGTVKWYISRIYAKLDVHSRRQAIERARQLELLEPQTIEPVSQAAVPLAQLAVNNGRAEPTLIGVSELVNPYKGLRAFQETDAADFFGRAALTEQLLARLTEAGDGGRFLAIAGPSGSGKSSVVRAGLLPALRRGALPNSSRWFIADMVPGTHPFEELEAALLRVSVAPIPGFRDQLVEDRRGLVRAAKRILPGDQDVELLLVIDQFEELFTLVDDEAVRAHFIDNLLSAATDPRSRIRIILTLRADFYDRPLNYPRLAELMRSHTEIALPMTTKELERAIAGPAERIGLRFEPGLVAAMITDVSAQPGALPLLQYALTELFERRSDLTLTLGTYHTSGGLAGALARRADELFDDLEADGQAAARQIFLRLVTLGDGAEDTRRRVLQAELESGIGVAAAVDEVLALYGKYRLLTFDRDPLTHGPTVEIAHEALIREWTRLRDWLSESRDELRIQRRLSSAAQEWIAAGRDVSFLASGARLTQFEALTAGELALTADEHAYVAASSADHSRREAESAAQQARELALAQQAAESAQQAATNAEKVVVSQRKLVTRMRQLAGTLAAFLIVAALLSMFAFNSRASALDNAATATYSQGQAINSEMTATVAQGQALNVAATSVANLNNANAQRLVSAANALLPSKTSNAETAALLAIRSLQLQYSDQAVEVLQAANDMLFTEKIWRNKAPWDAIYAPDGKTLLIITSDGAQLCDIASDCAVNRTFTGSAGIQRVQFSADGSRLFGVNGNGQVSIWDVNTATLKHQIDAGLYTQNGFVNGFQVSSDGKFALLAEYDPKNAEGQVALWNLETETKVNQWKGVGTGLAVALSPNGQYVVIVDKFTTEIWEPTGTAPVRTLTDKTYANSVAVSPDSRQIMTGALDGTATVWDAATGQDVHNLTGHIGPISQVKFSPNGKIILTASVDKTVRLWDTVTGLEVRRLTGHREGIYRADFSPDGLQVVTLSNDRDIRFWSADLSQSPGVLASGYGSLWSLSVSPDGTRLFTTDQTNNTGTLWQVSPLRVIRTVPGAAEASQFSSNGLIATASNPDSGDATVTLLDSRDGKILNTFTIPMTPGNPMNPDGEDIALSPDGKLIAPIGFDNFFVHIYNAADGHEVRSIFSGISDWPAAARFSPDSKYLLVGLYDSNAQLLDVTTGKIVTSYWNKDYYGNLTNGGSVVNVGFANNGKSVIVAHSYGFASLFDIHGFSRTNIQHSNSGGTTRAEFSPDGSLTLTSGYDSALRLWDAATGQARRTFPGHTGMSYGTFSPDGKLIYSVGFDGQIRRWFVDYHDLITDTCARIFRDLAPEDRNAYSLAGSDPTCPTSSATPTPIPATVAATQTPTATP